MAIEYRKHKGETMKKFFVLVAALSLSACAVSKDVNLIMACAYSNGDEAPAWTCNSSAALDFANLKNVAWVTGESKKLPAGRSLQKKVAVLDGRAKLLESIQVRVKSALRKHTVGSKAEQEINLFVESFAEGTLKGSGAYTRALDPGDGHMYVIVGIKNDQFRKNIEENEKYQALLQKIELDKAAGGKPAVNKIKQALKDISREASQ